MRLNPILSLCFLLLAASIGLASDKGLNRLICAIAQVESGGDCNARGDFDKKTGEYRAIGILQIWPITVKDANRIIGKDKYCLKDRYNRQKSIEICRIYLIYWAKHNKLKLDDSYSLSRIWNGGPGGCRKQSTIKYAEKAKKVLDKSPK